MNIKYIFRLLCVVFAFVVPHYVVAQTDEEPLYVDEEDCGCDLYFIDGIQKTYKDGKFGFKRYDGKILTPNIYTYTDRFQNGYCKVVKNDSLLGLIDSTGREVIPCLYQDIDYIREGLIRFMKDNRYGFLDVNNNVVIPNKYLAASSFLEGKAVVAVSIDSFSVRYGYIDKNDSMIIKPVYEYAMPFVEGVAVVKQYDRNGMIDTKGKEVLPIKYIFVSSMNNGYFWAANEDGLALFNNKMKPLTQFLYQDANPLSEKLYPVLRDGKWGYINTKGKEKIACQYDVAMPFKDGRAMVMKDKKYGIIDYSGDYILPLEYGDAGMRSQAYVFSEGLAMVEKDGKYGFIDRDGKIVIPLIYEGALHFADGLAPVCYDGKWGYINAEGKVVVPLRFQVASYFEHGRAEVYLNGKAHKINTKGQCVKNCKNFYN